VGVSKAFKALPCWTKKIQEEKLTHEKLPGTIEQGKLDFFSLTLKNKWKSSDQTIISETDYIQEWK
jgi:hypothetical protein